MEPFKNKDKCEVLTISFTVKRLFISRCYHICQNVTAILKKLIK